VGGTLLEREKKTPNVFICSPLFIVGGESQIRKGDKRMKVLGVIVILAVIDSRI
jgi:Na+-transporting NADH:ubiquinone oxidoreductase subunit NqrA